MGKTGTKEAGQSAFDFDEAPATTLPRGRLPSYIKDHRQRLRDRFMSGGADAMPDYELLELVLFRAVRRQDVKPLAHRLLKRFGDFNRVISASLFWTNVGQSKLVSPTVNP